MTLWRALVTQRHAVELIQQASPVVSKHLCILDSLAGPVLVPSADVLVTCLDDAFRYFVNFTSLDLWLSSQACKLAFIGLNPPLQIRDVVFIQSFPSFKHFSYAHEGISLALQILEHALIPATALILHQTLACPEVLAHGDESIVE
ncbi:hypothetical protein HG530_006125 [Fusarium avenaceum]|nr:hypothetical protein HG530_006125 [Fusarium avenaceum]